MLKQILIVGHYAEGQGDHYICLRKDQSVENNGTDYEPESEMDDDPEDDIDDPEGDMDDPQDDMDDPQGELEVDWDLLPNEIWLKIIRDALQQCDFSIENHVCFTFQSLRLVNQRISQLVALCIEELPRIYCNNAELLPKPKNGKHVVSVMSLIRKSGSCSGVVLELKRILNFSRWNSAWLVLLLCPHSWFVILSIFWRKRK